MKQILTLAILSLSFVVAGVASNNVRADISDLTIDTGCGSSTVSSYTGALKLPAGDYDVYVRLGQRGQQATVSGYARANASDSDCQGLGRVIASGDAWTKLKSVKSSGTDTETILQLQSKALSTRPDANRPTYLLQSKDHPVCDPNPECAVRVNGQTGYVRPPGTAPTQNSMQVVRVIPPEQDKVISVRYYVDQRLAYTDTALKPFDMRYVGLAGETLSRVVVYSSGQQVVFSQVVPEDFLDSFPNFLFKLQKENQGIINTVLVVIVMVVLLSATRLLGKRIEKRHQWRISHGIEHDESLRAMTQAEGVSLDKRLKLEKLTRIGFWVSGIFLAATLVSYTLLTFIFHISRVDGVSMQNTYRTGQLIVASRLPVTIANVNKQQFVPERGQVIIARHVYGILDQTVTIDHNATIIKRVLGLPGERVVVENGILTIYNKTHLAGFQPDISGSWKATMVKDTSPDKIDITLGDSELFVSGDNRPESIDSRFSGALDLNQVVGVVLTVL
jgi:signal peptidase I